jgi:hypothetical protein
MNLLHQRRKICLLLEGFTQKMINKNYISEMTLLQVYIQVLIGSNETLQISIMFGIVMQKLSILLLKQMMMKKAGMLPKKKCPI